MSRTVDRGTDFALEGVTVPASARTDVESGDSISQVNTLGGNCLAYASSLNNLHDPPYGNGRLSG